MPGLCRAAAIAALGVLCALLPACLAGGQLSDPVDSLMGGPRHLMFVSYMGRSHMIPYLDILKPLSERGHKITVITEQDALKWLTPNYPNYQVQLVPNEIWEGMQRKMPQIMASMLHDKGEQKAFANILEHVTLPYYKILSHALREIFTKDRPDLVLCDFMSDACADMADTLGIRLGVTLSGLPDGVSDASYVNGWGSSVLASTTTNMNTWQRFQNKFITPAKNMAAMRGNLRKLQQIKAEVGVVAPRGPPAKRFAHALKVVNTFIGFESARPLDPLVQLVGPIRSHANSTMPHDIQHWISNLSSGSSSSPGSSSSSNTSTCSSSSSSSSKQVIYVAFGTHIDLPDRVLTSLMTALVTTLDQGLADGVIWAVSNIKRNKFPADLDPRVMLLPFAPQKAVLASADVCLFVSHGGAESSHEAMYEGKPVLVIPFFGDQPMNAAKMSEAGFAEFLPHYHVTTERLQALLRQMLNPTPNPTNPTAPYHASYTAAARRQQALVRTLIKHNTQAAADMLLFFAYHGWDHLIPAGANMPWLKATDADLWIIFGLAVMTLLITLVTLLFCGIRAIARSAARMGSRSAAGRASQSKTMDEQFSPERSQIAHSTADVVNDEGSERSVQSIVMEKSLVVASLNSRADCGLVWRPRNGNDSSARPVFDLSAAAH